jgi:hypothetical protein
MIRFLRNFFPQRIIEMTSFLDEYYKSLREYEHVGCSILSFSVIQSCTIHCKVNELLLSEKRHQFILLFPKRIHFASHVRIRDGHQDRTALLPCCPVPSCPAGQGDFFSPCPVLPCPGNERTGRQGRTGQEYSPC